MKIIKNIFLFIPLMLFIGCQGPYHKPQKKPIKIGIAEKIAAVADGDEKQSIDETPTLDQKGIGPISEVTLGDEIDQDMAAAGEAYFNGICIACHMVDKRFVGPPMKGVLDLRAPEWVMNMILNTDQMLSEDPVAKALLEEYGSPMIYMGTTEEEARQLLEFFRTL